MKLSTKNINKILDICTKKEIDLIIHITQFQDKQGIIKGINYKDVLKSINISKSTFYKLLYSLEEKNIIKINYFNEHAYWEVKIIDNVFATNEDYKKGYIKLNYAILYSDYFLKMTKSEKVIVLNLLKINDYRKHMIKITYKKIAEWTGKSLRSVKKFVDTLTYVLNIKKQDNLCLIDCLVGFESRTQSEINTKNKHLIDYRLKKAKCQSSIEEITDTLTVLKQYKIEATEQIITLLDKVISGLGGLVPKYINKLAQLV